MPEIPVNPSANRRFVIRGKRAVELDLGDHDLSQYVVVQKDIDPNAPSEWNGIKIDWFVSFGIRHRKPDQTPGDFADIPYTVILDALPTGKRLFAYYRGAVHELDFKPVGNSNKIKVTLSVGDPPIGSGP